MPKAKTHTVKVGGKVYYEIMQRQLEALKRSNSRPTVDEILMSALRIKPDKEDKPDKKARPRNRTPVSSPAL